MATFTPGCILLWKDPDSGQLWPAVYLTDDIVPKTFQDTRPPNLSNLILKLSQVASVEHLRWAKASSLNTYDPVFAAKQRSSGPPEVAAAYDVADRVLDRGLRLQHWKYALISQDIVIISDNDDDQSDDEMDEDMRCAIEQSLLDVRAEETQMLLTASTASSTSVAAASQTFSCQSSNQADPLSPLHRVSQANSRLPEPTHALSGRLEPHGFSSQSPKRTLSSSSEISENKRPSPPRRRKMSSGQDSTHIGIERRWDSAFDTSSSIFGDEFRLPPSRRKSSTQNAKPAYGRLPQRPARRKESASNQGPSASRLYSQNGSSTAAASEADDDIIEGDLEDSNQFVQVFVGPEVDPDSDPEADPQRKRHRFQLLKGHVSDRSYFRNNVHAISYIMPIGENTWELAHPKLSNIDPGDFKFAAEYLTDGEFGHRQPDGEDQIEEAFAQCISAWEVAQQLSMDDLQEHVIEKIQSIAPWDMYNVFALACCIYSSAHIPSQACRRLRDMLCSFIAEHYTIYMRDEALRKQFLDRIDQLPELGVDVHLKVAEVKRRHRRPEEQARELLEQEDIAIS